MQLNILCMLIHDDFQLTVIQHFMRIFKTLISKISEDKLLKNTFKECYLGYPFYLISTKKNLKKIEC